MKKYGWILYKLIIASGLAYSTYLWTHYYSFNWRGYVAYGGEVLLALFVGIGVFIGLDKWNEWLKKREAKEKHV